ncbi:MAG: dTMP kinase [Gemmataceae bacterium]
MVRSCFLSLDGPDGTGKSTQCRLLAEWLRSQGTEVVVCQDPGGTSLGQALREILLTGKHHPALAAEALLFMASRAQLVAEVIRPALDRGVVVVSDRFLLANVVYQGHAGLLDVELLWKVGQLSTGGLVPDLTLVLDLPLEQSLVRRGRPADHLESRPTDFHERVRAGFLLEAQRRANTRVIDASPPVEVVQQAIRAAFTQYLLQER